MFGTSPEDEEIVFHYKYMKIVYKTNVATLYQDVRAVLKDFPYGLWSWNIIRKNEKFHINDNAQTITRHLVGDLPRRLTGTPDIL